MGILILAAVGLGYAAILAVVGAVLHVVFERAEHRAWERSQRGRHFS